MGRKLQDAVRGVTLEPEVQGEQHVLIFRFPKLIRHTHQLKITPF
jgi:hypothetical protein